MSVVNNLMQGFVKGLSHDQLLIKLHDLIARDHAHEAELIVHLGEVDARRLYLEQACPSMFHYCVHVLHFAEGVAYKRIAVARAAREFPKLLAALEHGDLHLTAASLLAPHLDHECAAQWLAAARHKTAQEIKQWIADRKPKADVKTSLRKTPVPRWTADTSKLVAPTGAARLPAAVSPYVAPVAAAPVAVRDGAERDRARSEPLGADRYCVRLTIDAVVHEELQELRSLLRHQIPDGDVAKIIERAVHVLLEQVRKQKRGARSSVRSPRARAMPGPDKSVAGANPTNPSKTTAPPDVSSKRPSRKIPAEIRRAVWERDEGRCSYVSREGRQCETRDFLEFHHQVPWARCREHRASNIHLRCRSHNQHAAELDFGAQHMAVYRKRERAFAPGDAAAERAGEPEPQLDLNPPGVASADQGAVHEPAEIQAPEQQALGLGAD